MGLKSNHLQTNYKLYSNVIPVAGFKKGILCDLFRNQIFQVPKDFIEILDSNSEIDMADLILVYGKDNEKTLEQYLSFLLDWKLVFSGSSNVFENLPVFNLEWDMPITITNAQIAIGKNTCLKSLEESFLELKELGCQAIAFILVDISLNSIFEIFQEIEGRFNFVFDILLDHRFNCDEKTLVASVHKLNNVVNVKICQSKFEKIEKSSQFKNLTFSWLKMPLRQMPCSVINTYSFNPTLEFFCEAKSFNSCLNRKVCIDENGSVKNCFAMQRTFGNIKFTKIREIIDNPDFSFVWQISKDKIDSCRDCEYRYVCHDCRAFLEDMENQFSKPEKCKYNPYKGEWEN